MFFRDEFDNLSFLSNHLQNARALSDAGPRNFKEIPLFSKKLEIIAFKKMCLPGKGYLHIQRKGHHPMEIDLF
jgi:hypothetical protein